MLVLWGQREPMDQGLLVIGRYHGVTERGMHTGTWEEHSQWKPRRNAQRSNLPRSTRDCHFPCVIALRHGIDLRLGSTVPVFICIALRLYYIAYPSSQSTTIRLTVI